jgi:hypothetical protein
MGNSAPLLGGHGGAPRRADRQRLRRAVIAEFARILEAVQCAVGTQQELSAQDSDALSDAAMGLLEIYTYRSFGHTGRWAGVSHWKAQKQQDSFATLVTQMDRVSAGPQGCSRGRTLGSKQDPANIPANSLPLEECQPQHLGDSHGSVSCSEWLAGYGSSGSCLALMIQLRSKASVRCRTGLS